MSAVLFIWSGNKFCTEEYVETIPVFTGEKCNIPQVVIALDCAGEKGRRVSVPDFFEKSLKMIF